MVLNEHGSFSPYLIHYKMHMSRSKYNSVQCTGIPLWPLWLEDRVCCFFCFYLIAHTFTKCMCQLTQWSIFFLNAFLSISVPQIHLSVVKMLLLSMMTHLLKMWNTKKRTVCDLNFNLTCQLASHSKNLPIGNFTTKHRWENISAKNF